MNEPPRLLRPVRHTSGGQSPTRQRLSDDIMSHLTPATAVDALTSATGPLRTCLARASAGEREFAMQCAVASRSIWEWVDELQEWPWPEEGGSAGFDEPSERERDPFAQGVGERYLGSLPASDVARYEMRVEDISHGLEELAVEEIKSHVMTNHILPLSRPTTPISDHRSISSTVSNYNRMEDLTAVVTAMVVQTLPNLAKLSRLLQIWSIRICILQRIPALLMAIEKAEHALRSGWVAINTPPTGQAGAEMRSSLTRADFNVMKSVIDKQLAVPGRHLDFMLDRLEGYMDTLPEGWLDRVEVMEHEYADWVAACEHKIRSADWTRSIRSESRPVSSDAEAQDGSSARSRSKGLPVVGPDGDPAITLPVPVKDTDSEEPSKRGRDRTGKAKASRDADAMAMDGTSDGAPSTLIRPPTPTAADRSHLPRVKTSQLPSTLDGDSPRTPEDMSGSSGGEDELELPPLRGATRRSSASSQTSTVLHGASSQFDDISSDLPEVSASPDISRLRIRQAQYVRSTESPPSSPPLPEPDSRETSMVTSENPTETGRDDNDDSTLPRTPIEGSFSESFFDDSFTGSEIGSPPPWQQNQQSRDQHLQRQISEIIENIPAKIRLTKEPPNLNPPDLQLPKLRQKPSKEPFKRSVSSLSQRTVTPSFTLSPAKNLRPRSRTQQEIKVYHLARSTGEAPIKLFIRCVGENGERVMVRVGGGWADLSEYLKEYASHHGRRSAGTDKAKVEVRSSPPSRPASALDTPMTPLAVRKTRRESEAAKRRANTPLPMRIPDGMEPGSEERGMRSRSNSRLSWVEDDSSFLGLAGPSGKKVEMSEENKAWVESVKEKVRLASGERRVPSLPSALQQAQRERRSQTPEDYNKERFGELGKVGGTKRIFRKPESAQGHRDGKKKD